MFSYSYLSFFGLENENKAYDQDQGKILVWSKNVYLIKKADKNNVWREWPYFTLINLVMKEMEL